MKRRAAFSVSIVCAVCVLACTAPQRPTTFDLAEPGEYRVGAQSLWAEDTARDDRPVRITVWYPALESAELSDSEVTRDAAPDSNGAPYPVIISSSKVGWAFAPMVVSHGFAWVGVDGIDAYPVMGYEAVDQPLDLLFALDYVATSPPTSLAGVLGTERAGAIGYSFDGYNALAMSGARIDPAYYLAQCPTPDAITKSLVSNDLTSFSCDLAKRWPEFEAHAGLGMTRIDEGLWQPMTDERIRAVMPLAAEGWWLFGERGLASVDRPVLMIVASEDELYRENAVIYQHLGVKDKSLISVVGPGHMMIADEEMVARMAHFAVAFFGYHLADRQDHSWYFSERFVAGHEDLVWGVIEDD